MQYCIYFFNILLEKDFFKSKTEKRRKIPPALLAGRNRRNLRASLPAEIRRPPNDRLRRRSGTAPRDPVLFPSAGTVVRAGKSVMESDAPGAG